MREIIWREDTSGNKKLPQSPEEARERLNAGNAAFVNVGCCGGSHVIPVGPAAFGLPDEEGAGVVQKPFAAMLGCSDARVPIELVFGQASNDIYVVRVAGNVPGTECLGSLHYAIDNLPSIKVVTVLGHTGCGAVSAAVDAMLHPHTYLEIVHNPDLRAIVDSLLAGVRMAAVAFEETYGPEVVNEDNYREALVDTAVVANTAITATMLNEAIRSEVTFGIFDIEKRTVGTYGKDTWVVGLANPPLDDAGLAALLLNTARSYHLSGNLNP